MAKAKTAVKEKEQVQEERVEQENKENIAEQSKTEEVKVENTENSTTTQTAEVTEKTEKVETLSTEQAQPTEEKDCVYKVAKATYTKGHALNFLRKKLFAYQELDRNFLDKLSDDENFQTEIKYISVVRCRAKVKYEWKTKTGGEVYDHSGSKALAKEFCDDVEELNPFDFTSAEFEERELTEEDGKLLAGMVYPLERAKKDFNAFLKQASPNKRARVIKEEEKYETVYIPVMKTSLAFEGETYLGYINLVNGECIVEYKVSKRLQGAIENKISQVKRSKSLQIHSLLFMLCLALMGFGKTLYYGLDQFNLPVLWISVIIGGLASVPVFGLLFLKRYKKEGLEEKGVYTGKMPEVKGARAVVFCSWLACVVAVALFFLKVVI